MSARDLATEARRLSAEVELLKLQVERTVDVIAAIPARDAMLQLDDLVELLDTIDSSSTAVDKLSGATVEVNA